MPRPRHSLPALPSLPSSFLRARFATPRVFAYGVPRVGRPCARASLAAVGRLVCSFGLRPRWGVFRPAHAGCASFGGSATLRSARDFGRYAPPLPSVACSRVRGLPFGVGAWLLAASLGSSSVLGLPRCQVAPFGRVPCGVRGWCVGASLRSAAYATVCKLDFAKCPLCRLRGIRSQYLTKRTF